MRWFLLAVIVGLAVLGYFFGLRFGYLSLTPLWTYNAQGQNQYTYNRVDPDGGLKIVGSCDAREGSVALRLFAPGGGQIASALCRGGAFNLAMNADGAVGLYRLEVDFDRYTGRLEINEERSGKNFQN